MKNNATSTKIQLTRNADGTYRYKQWRIVRLQGSSSSWVIYDTTNPLAADVFWSLRCVRLALAKA